MYIKMSKNILRFALALCAVSLARPADLPNTLTAQEKKEGFLLLFNGKDLTGWDGAPGNWSVKDGAIVGSTEGHPLKHNSFLIYKDQYANFVLRFDIKLRNLNTGVQFRSDRADDWVVTGLQADASEAGPEHSAWGNLYDEKGKGRFLMKSQNEGWDKVKSKVRHGDWNQYEVIADGHHVTLRLNGVETISQDVERTAAGVLAIQIHLGEPMQTEVRNIRLKPLK